MAQQPRTRQTWRMALWPRAETRGAGRSWLQANHFPSVARNLASSQILLPHRPTGSPRETHRIPAHAPSAPIGKPCAARGLERVNPNEAASQVLGVARATGLLTMGGAPRHAKVWVNHQPLVPLQNQRSAPRGKVYFHGYGK